MKGDRIRPVAQTKSELEVVEASIREVVDGRAMIKKQPFVRVKATLATAATALSEDIPNYDPVALIDAGQPIAASADQEANPEIYGTDVEGEVQIRTTALPVSFVPPPAISDKLAANFVRLSVESVFGDGGTGESAGLAMAYADPGTGVATWGW